jgi:hypothetical protein
MRNINLPVERQEMMVKELTVNRIDADGSVEYLDLVSSSDHEGNGDFPEYWDEVFHTYPPLTDYPKDIKHVGETTQGEAGPGSIGYILASAPSIVAFAGLIKAFIFRHKYEKVEIYWKNGKKRLVVHGGMSAQEIEQLMRAQIGESAEAAGGRQARSRQGEVDTESTL